MNIIAVDWSQDARKRSAYRAELSTLRVSRLPFDGSLSHLLQYASSLKTPVLIGIDAAIGFPNASWGRLTANYPNQFSNFIDFLLNASLPVGFFEPVTKPEDWAPEHPFIRPPPGPWSMKAFDAASNGGFYRRIDTRLNGKPIFVTCGIPGSVGSGTRALWQELIAIGEASKFRVWPFHGALNPLLNTNSPVIAEIYPKACYGIVLSKILPAPLMSIAKTKEVSRQDALEQLEASDWVASSKVELLDLEAALSNEDDFDALMSAAALLRMFIGDAPLDNPGDSYLMIEGSVLGATSLTKSATSMNNRGPKRSTQVPKKSVSVSKTYQCPIPGCQYVFKGDYSE